MRTTNAAAILAGDQRSARFKYRHSVVGAARELGIPASWIWAWLLLTRLQFKMRLRKIWVRLDDVQNLFANLAAVREAYYATREFLTSPEAIQRLTQRWPGEAHRFVEASGKKPSTSVKAEQEVAYGQLVYEEEEREVVA
jgi:hypothetical protein